MKKKIEMCDWCGDEQAAVKIIKGSEKGSVLCDECFDDWSEAEIEDKFEDIE